MLKFVGSLADKIKAWYIIAFGAVLLLLSFVNVIRIDKKFYGYAVLYLL